MIQDFQLLMNGYEPDPLHTGLLLTGVVEDEVFHGTDSVIKVSVR